MSADRVLVYLSACDVLWTRWSSGHCIDMHACPVTDQPQCPWSELAMQGVTLIVDVDLQDVERVASRGFGRDPVGLWQRLLFTRERRRAGKAGRLFWLSANASIAARGSIVTEQWPAVIGSWVTAIHRNAVTFDYVLSAACVLASSVPRSSAPTLFVTNWTGVTRHLLCADGALCLSRVIDPAEDPVDAVNVSLAHVIERWQFTQVDVSLPPVCQASGREAGLRITSMDGVSIVHRDSISNDWGSGSGAIKDTLLHSLHRRALLPWRSRWLAYRCCALSDSYVIAGQKQRQGRALKRLQWLAALSLCITLSVAVHASVTGLEHVRQVAAVTRDHALLLSGLNALRSDAQTLHARPQYAASTVEQASSLAAAAPMPADLLLPLIATHITGHPEVMLDRVHWRTFQESQDASAGWWLQDGVMQASEPEWLKRSAAHLPTANLLVELAGRIAHATDLQHAQGLSDTWFDALRADPAIQQCQVLESPLTQAVDGPSQQALYEPQWQLRCVLHTTASSDAAQVKP